MTHQDKTNTGINRYPDIFKFCKDFKSDSTNILSFGCSSGEEVVTLSMFFGDSNIYGVDINKEMLEKCRLKFKNIDRIITSDKIPDGIKFDMIFCMSVFCRWPDTEDIDDCSNIYRFNQFDESISELDLLLKDGGVLVVYNSNFLFTDTTISSKYKRVDRFSESGFVHKFSKDNKRLYIIEQGSIFQKQNSSI